MLTETVEIPGFPGYRAGKDGSIYSCKRTKPCRLKLYVNGDGYLIAKLYRVGEVPKHIAAHRLVLLAFVGSPPIGAQVDHVNRDTTDNRLSNLRYVTPKINCSNRRTTYLTGDEHWTRRNPQWITRGEAHKSTKLTAAQIEYVKYVCRKPRGQRPSMTAIAAELGVHKSHISLIAAGKTRRHG